MCSKHYPCTCSRIGQLRSTKECIKRNTYKLKIETIIVMYRFRFYGAKKLKKKGGKSKCL